MELQVAVSVDLDSLPHYARIHGLGELALDERARNLVATTAIPRLLELLVPFGGQATFFVIGQDVDATLSRALWTAATAGVELASHSHSHDYALSRRSLPELEADLALAEDAIARVCGQRPAGFRAPGYTLSKALVQALCRRGYAYDSSVFPAAPYYLAKAGVMAALAALGRPSRSVLDSPRVLLAPRVPYRPSFSHPYVAGDAPLLELPVAVTPLGRLPLIGTVVTTFPRQAVELLYAGLSGEPLFNLELHAIDVLDDTDGIPKAIAARQPDVRVPARTKLRRLQALLSTVAARRRFVTLAAFSQAVHEGRVPGLAHLARPAAA